MIEAKQDPSAVPTYLDDWTDHLAQLPDVLTITSADVTATRGATVTDVTPATTGVRFRLNVATVPLNTTVTVRVAVTLSNGDTDVRRHSIQVINT